MYQIKEKYKANKESIEGFISEFDNSGELFVKGNRNSIKLFNLDALTLNIKSFKKPNLINKIAYRYFRTSLVLCGFA